MVTRNEKFALILGASLGIFLIWGSVTRRLPLALTEVFGFITGAIGVYLTVKRSLWNFPIGLANNIFFGVLFFQARLFNDMGLQVVFFVLGVWGWRLWALGKTDDRTLPIGRASWKDWVGCGVFIVCGTFVLMEISRYFSGAAPFWDALTTALSLAAQGLLGRKILENWAFWLLADIIYVPLYFSRDLHLTGALYFGFGGLCVLGYTSWKRQWNDENVGRGSK